MGEHDTRGMDDLSTLDGIRAYFEARQRALGRGFHALGDEVYAQYCQAADELPKPVSAMTFRNFLQGKTTLRDPTGLELYFEALGATVLEMKSIRATLRQELDRKIASPRQTLVLKGFEDADLDTMPFSRALAECEMVTRVEDSVAAIVTHLTPREYLLGVDGTRKPHADPERWGILQHLDDLTLYMAKLDAEVARAMALLPRADLGARRVQAAADLREAASAYAYWLVYRPRAADLFFSRRRYMLHGFFPEEERELAIALAKRVARLVFGFLERFALTMVATDKRELALLRTPPAENALEVVAERVLAVVDSFYLTVVQGAQGTGAMFRAHNQLRRRNGAAHAGWTEAHESLITEYDAAVDEANRRIEENVRVPYRELRGVYDEHIERMRESALVLWESDFAGNIVRQTLSLLLSELHAAGVLSDATFLARTKELCVGKEADAIRWAKHRVRMFRPPGPWPNDDRRRNGDR